MERAADDIDRMGRAGHLAERRVGILGRTAKRTGVLLRRGLGVAARGAALGIGLAVGGLAFAVKQGYDEFTALNLVTQQTKARMKSTGGAAGVTAKDVRKLSKSLEDMSSVDENLIGQGQNLLLTFRNIRNEVGAGNDIFTQATKGALNLSTAGFGDMNSASKMLGKALNDPIKGMTAMSRAGVTFSESQQETITKLQESGDLLGAQKIILKELEKQVGGSARKYGESFEGGVNKMKDAWGDLTRNVFRKLRPTITKAMESITEWINSPDGGKAVVKWLGRNVPKAIEAVGKWLGGLGKWWRDHGHTVKGVAQFIKNTVTLLINGVRFWVGLFRAAYLGAVGIALKVVTVFRTMATGVLDAAKFLLLKMIQILAPLPGNVEAPFVAAYNKVNDFQNDLDDTLGGVEKSLKGMRESTKGSLSKQGNDWDGYANQVTGAISRVGRRWSTWQQSASQGSAPTFTGLAGSVGGRARGGPVRAGVPYVVGEREAEVFIPRQHGRVEPPAKLGGSSVGGDTTTYVTINVNGAQSPRQTAKEIKKILGDDLARA